MNENACQGFEIAIEMRRHGADDPDASRRLDEHLLGCAGCRAYEKLGAETETGLRTDAEEARQKADLERLRTRGFRLVVGRWSDLGAFYLLIAVAWTIRFGLKVAGVVEGSPLSEAWIPLWVLIVHFDMQRMRREIEEAWSSDTLFYAIRKDLNHRLLGSGVLAVLAVGYAAFALAFRALGRGGLPTGGFALAFAAGLGALGLFVLAARVPRLLRELREIPDVPDPYQHSSESIFGLL
jgi:hypothetical protein